MKHRFLIILVLFLPPLISYSQNNIHQDIRSVFEGKAFPESQIMAPGDSCTVNNPERHDGFQHANGYTAFTDSVRAVVLFHPQSYPWRYTKICVGWTSIGGVASLNYRIIMYDSSTGGDPGNILYYSALQTATNVPGFPLMNWYSSTLALPVVTGTMKSCYIGIVYDNNPATNCYLSVDESQSTPFWPEYYAVNTAWPPFWQQFIIVPPYNSYLCLAIRTEGENVLGIGNNGGDFPKEYSINQNYPNPFNPSTTISFGIPEKGLVKITVYDLAGREVVELVNEVKNAGTYPVTFDGSSLASGVYFYRMVAGEFTATKKMLLIK